MTSVTAGNAKALLELVTDEGDAAESEISKPIEQEEQVEETQPAGEVEDLEAMAAELGADEPVDLESMAAELDAEPAADDDADLEAMAVRPPPMTSVRMLFNTRCATNSLWECCSLLSQCGTHPMQMQNSVSYRARVWHRLSSPARTTPWRAWPRS